MSQATNPAPKNAESIVVLDGLQKKYGKFTAVNSISLEVPYGVVYGVLGPNGAGKTTTLRMITGLLRPTGGSIVIDGHDMATNDLEAKRITGFIPDRPYVYDKLTAFEYLRFVAGLYAMPAELAAKRIPELLQMFQLAEWGDSLIENFSHGMKQRVVFAGALLPNPKLLVVDEPMVGLDPNGHRIIKELFRTLADEHNMTILLSTHTLEVAEQVCDKIAIINHGRIIARGTLQELRVESGESNGSLEEVFLKLTEEREEQRREAVAERFGNPEKHAAGPFTFDDTDNTDDTPKGTP